MSDHFDFDQPASDRSRPSHRRLDRQSDLPRQLAPTDDEWPAERLQTVPVEPCDVPDAESPESLWVSGQLRPDQLAERAIAIVGTRAATPYGLHVASQLGYWLAIHGWTIASTGGYGIASAAHRGALGAGGTTFAVLSSGLDHLYPSGHSNLFDRIRHDGALVTEFPPEATPSRSRALARNRLLTRLTSAMVVVEAPVRGETLDAARWAVTYGRPLMAVPGPVTSAASTGCHRLLQAGTAHLVTDGPDIATWLDGRIGPAATIL